MAGKGAHEGERAIGKGRENKNFMLEEHVKNEDPNRNPDGTFKEGHEQANTTSAWDFGNDGQPAKYKEEYVAKVEEYLAECKDGYTKHQDSEGKTTKTTKKVMLPTIEGFARKLGFVTKTLYNWAKVNPAFLHALARIEEVQKERLINEGLAGNYNFVIGKLLLSANHGMREGKDITSKGQIIKSNEIVFADFSEEEDQPENEADSK